MCSYQKLHVKFKGNTPESYLYFRKKNNIKQDKARLLVLKS